MSSTDRQHPAPSPEPQDLPARDEGVDAVRGGGVEPTPFRPARPGFMDYTDDAVKAPGKIEYPNL